MMPPIDRARLAQRLGWRLPASIGARPELRELAGALLKLGAEMPPGTGLLLGGSFARGEPCLRRRSSRLELMSDFDFVLIYEDPPPPVGEEVVLARAAVLTGRSECFALRRDQFEGLETSIGYDLKRGGIWLAGEPADLSTLPASTPTRRDGLELLAYAIVEFYAEGMARRLAAGEGGENMGYRVSRLVLNALRAAALDEGCEAYHELANRDDALREAALPELAWRDALEAARAPPHERLRRAFGLALGIFDRRSWPKVALDAVTGTRYEDVVGSDFVARVQTQALELMRRQLHRLGQGRRTARDLHVAEAAAWRELLASDNEIIRPTPSPEGYFLRCQPAFKELLLTMKVDSPRHLRRQVSGRRCGGAATAH